ncbi:Nn.00g101480.m01.CDS01 [Neocucurbitaria sp. VM-36]
MRFSITSAVAIMVGLTASGSAFVIDTFGGTNCDGVVETGVNIWDNTCATWPNGFRSFKITVWGGNHQMAYFFAPDNCGSLPGAIKKGYVDSTTYDFKLGDCYNFGGAAANAIASYAG